jgi:hypothetical protein
MHQKKPMDMLNEALRYAAHDWAVFPVHSPRGNSCSCGNPGCSSVGKHPKIRHGVLAATTDSETIRNWWKRWPDANIGIHVGRSSLVVMDIDFHHGGRVDDLPLTDADRITPTALTGGGGIHLAYQAPPGQPISNSNKRLPEGIDLRAGRAYIVAPPSLHVSGRCYVWRPGRSPWDVEPRALPEALLPMLVIKGEPPGRDAVPARLPDTSLNREGHHPYVAAALRSELDKLAQAIESNRNNTLNESAFNLGQFIEAGLLPRGEVEMLLQEAAREIGLGETETRQTIKSGIEAGMRNPRRVWPDLS